MDDARRQILEFCYGGGRAVPLSIFLGRIVKRGEPQWLDGDRLAALEWLEYERSLCPGCQTPKAETWDIGMDDAYNVIPVVCHKCAAVARAAHVRNKVAGPDAPPEFGLYLITVPEERNAAATVEDAG